MKGCAGWFKAQQKAKTHKRKKPPRREALESLTTNILNLKHDHYLPAGFGFGNSTLGIAAARSEVW